jgi:predicted metalloendopeptidase
MTKTNKKKISKNKTRKIKLKPNYLILRKDCPINLKPFEDSYFKKYKTLQSYFDIKDNFIKAAITRFSPTAIKPQDDFYSYINYRWLQQISLEKQQKYIIQVDDFRLTQDKVYHQLNEIILDYIKNNNDSLSKELKNFYNSVINMNSITTGKIICQKGIEKIDEMLLNNNPWELLAYFNKYDYYNYLCPFVFSMESDERNSKKFISTINSHIFILLDMSVYYNDGTNEIYKNMYRNNFKKYCKKLFNQCLGKNHGYNTDDIYDVEVQIFESLGCDFINNNNNEEYFKISSKEAVEKYNFNWNEFAKQLGFNKVPDYFVTSNVNYLKCGSDLFLKNWNSLKWKSYWIYIILQFVSRTTKKWELLNYEFFGKFQKGQGALNETDAVSASLYMSVPFNTFLTEKYVEKYSDPNKINYVSVLSEELKKVFIRILKNNKWLQEKTKQKAIEKIKHLKFIIGYPEKLRIDPKLDYNNNLFENIEKITTWRFKHFINLEGKEIISLPFVDWSQYPVKLIGDQAYIVNASYTPTRNEIYINLGYIQKPFIDLDERGIEYNLAHIGYTISHEMAHALDDWGSQYDIYGNLNDWWTEKDKKRFKKIQEDVTKQYEEFALRDGIVYDASISIGENIADISAMGICEQYLTDFQTNNADILPVCRSSYEVFFDYFAFQQKQKVTKKALRAQLKTNPHPLDKYRCNIPLSRSNVFRAIYNVKKENQMWWHNTSFIW